MKKVDAHAHVFKVGLKLASNRRYAPEYTTNIDEFIKNFESKGLSAGMLIQPSFLGTDNSYMIDTIAQYPDKLWGVAVVDSDVSITELKQLSQSNIVGIRLNLYGKKIPNLKDAKWNNLLSFIKNAGWHVELHIDGKDLPPLVNVLLERKIKIVIDHFGKPTADNPLEDSGIQYLLSVAKSKLVWIKISGVYRLKKELGIDAGAEVAKVLINNLLDVYGPERLLWGSDWPHTQFESLVNYDWTWNSFLQMVPNEETRNIILSKSFYELIENK